MFVHPTVSKKYLCPNRGWGIVANAYISQGTLIAEASGPLALVPKNDLKCPALQYGTTLSTYGAFSGPTPCENCLCCYSHSREVYIGVISGTVTEKPVFRCSNCRSVFYCSKECQIESWKFHKNECELLRELSDFRCCVSPTIRLLLHCIIADVDLKGFSHTSSKAGEQCNCKKCSCMGSIGNSENNDQDIKSMASSLQKLFENLKQHRAEKLGCMSRKIISKFSKFSLEDIQRLILKISRNVFSISSIRGLHRHENYGTNTTVSCVCCDMNAEIAIALYSPPVIYFNHSCSPNSGHFCVDSNGSGKVTTPNRDAKSLSSCFIRGKNRGMRIVATRDIRPGEEITISYLILTEFPRNFERRCFLWNSYNFICTCSRCCSCRILCDFYSRNNFLENQLDLNPTSKSTSYGELIDKMPKKVDFCWADLLEMQFFLYVCEEDKCQRFTSPNISYDLLPGRKYQNSNESLFAGSFPFLFPLSDDFCEKELAESRKRIDKEMKTENIEKIHASSKNISMSDEMLNKLGPYYCNRCGQVYSMLWFNNVLDLISHTSKQVKNFDSNAAHSASSIKTLKIDAEDCATSLLKCRKYVHSGNLELGKLMDVFVRKMTANPASLRWGLPIFFLLLEHKCATYGEFSVESASMKVETANAVLFVAQGGVREAMKAIIHFRKVSSFLEFENAIRKTYNHIDGRRSSQRLLVSLAHKLLMEASDFFYSCYGESKEQCIPLEVALRKCGEELAHLKEEKS